MNLIGFIVILAITLSSTADIAEAANVDNICRQDSCYSCVDYSCTKFCMGLGCRKCLDGFEGCCQEGDCNLCFGQRCCSNTTCNQCIGSCMMDCGTESTCYHTCFDKCSPPEVQNLTRVFYNVNRNAPFNVTTTINITNTVNNTNYIDTIIYANKTNNNTINMKDALMSYFNLSSINNSTTKKYIRCCNVTHPKSCHTIGSAGICQLKKHIECSPICKSPHVLIGPGNGTLRRLSVMVPPYVYYGNYDIIDCEMCYICAESSNVEVCSRRDTCSKICRSHMQMPGDSSNIQFRQDQRIPHSLYQNLGIGRPSHMTNKKYTPNQKVIVVPSSGIQAASGNPILTALNSQQYYPDQGTLLGQVYYPTQNGANTNAYYPDYTSNIPRYQSVEQPQYSYPVYNSYQGAQYQYPSRFPSSGSQASSNAVMYAAYPVHGGGFPNQYAQGNGGYPLY